MQSRCEKKRLKMNKEILFVVLNFGEEIASVIERAMVEKSEKVEYIADKTIATLQAENERLQVENQSLRGAANSLKMHYEEAQAEIKGLQSVNDEKFRQYRHRRKNGAEDIAKAKWYLDKYLEIDEGQGK